MNDLVTIEETIIGSAFPSITVVIFGLFNCGLLTVEDCKIGIDGNKLVFWNDTETEGEGEVEVKGENMLSSVEVSCFSGGISSLLLLLLLLVQPILVHS